MPIYDAIDGHFMSAARFESVSSDTHVGILETKHVNSVKKKNSVKPARSLGIEIR